jgi:inner membrane protein
MAWWGWVLVGTMLLSAELMIIEADFYLVFLGIAAVTVGFLDVAGFGGPRWVEWLMFAGIAVGSTVLFRQRVYAQMRPPGGPVSDSVVGETAKVEAAMAPGAHGHAELRGSLWQAKNVGEAPLGAGDRARITGIDGLTLLVRADT